MDWMEEVSQKMKRRNQVLFAKDSILLQELAMLLAGQPHRTVVLWALELAEGTVRLLEGRYPGECRPRSALEASRLWASGKIKMPPAQKEILRCHALAKEMVSAEDIALCHAVGQACATVHTAGHALGYPMYELTAMIRRSGLEESRELVERRMAEYLERLRYWQGHTEDPQREWAGFLSR